MSFSSRRSSLSAPLSAFWVPISAIESADFDLLVDVRDGRIPSLTEASYDRFAPTGRKTQGEFGQNTRKPDRRRPSTTIPAPWRVKHAGRKFDRGGVGADKVDREALLAGNLEGAFASQTNWTATELVQPDVHIPLATDGVDGLERGPGEVCHDLVLR